MKKRLMMVAVLLGALTLGACVDDNESQSVTDLRNAKAEQLKSVAALNNAQAEAALIAANAEAEMKKAEAAYQKALTDAANAATAEKEMLIEQAKQKFTEDMKLLQAKYAAKIAEFNADKKKWDDALWAKTEAHIQAVYNAYTGSLGNVNNFTQYQLELKVQKATAEAKVITAEESLKQMLAGLNIEKAQKERELAKWTAMKEIQPTKDTYLAKLDELEKQAYDITQNKLPEVNAAKKPAQKAYNDAKDAFEDGEFKFAVAAEELNDLLREAGSFASFAYYSSVQIAKESVDKYTEDFGYPDGNFLLYCYSLPAESQIQRATIDVDNYFTNELKAADNAIKEAEGEEWKKDANGNIIDDPWDIYSVKGAESALAYRKQKIAEQKKFIVAKEKEIADAEKEATPDKTKIEQLKNDLKSLNSSLATLEDVRDLEQNITYQKEHLAKKKADKTEIEEAQKAYKANLVVLKDAAALKTYNDAIKALDPLAVVYIDKQAAVAPITAALKEMGFYENGNKTGSGEYADVKNLLDGIKDVQSYINDCNTRLANIAATLKLGNLNTLVTMQEIRITVYNPITGQMEYRTVYAYVLSGNGTITLADAIALFDAQIKQYDEWIRIEKTLADKYKAELDALIATTPAE